jgi:hypothetical protein
LNKVLRALTGKEKLAYLIGLFDGEGCLTLNIVRDTRKRFLSEAGGWRVIPCVQFTNSDSTLVRTVAMSLSELGYNPTIQKYPNGSAHVRLFRLEEVERFCKKAMKYSHGGKLAQLKIFVDELIPILDARPPMRSNKRARFWTRELFLRAVSSIDRINQYKRSRRTARRYNRKYFEELWGLN